MSKSNWKGCAAWQAVPDYTNILENNCLYLTTENKDFAEDYILQKLGTSTGLTYLNIGIKFNYAWPSISGTTISEFGAVVRADSFTTGTTFSSVAQDAYIGKINKETKEAYICKRHNNALLTLMIADLPSSALSNGTKNSFELRSYGTGEPFVKLIINGETIISFNDTSPFPKNTGYVGLHCSTGNVYITSLVLLEYDDNGR